eukprot:m51a1_g4644 hypothetical protein (145) ;mRNA; f:349936-350370
MALMFGTNFWDEMDALNRQLDGVSSRQSHKRRSPASDASWSPLCDLSETKTDYLIVMDVPGVRKEDISIDLHEGILSIVGARASACAEGSTALRCERPKGKFSRSFTVPQGVDPATIKASFDNGVLSVSIAKPKAAIPYKVEIK